MAKDRLDLAQQEVFSTYGKSGSMARAIGCLKEYTSLALAEGAFLKQKSRNKWLQLGDQNIAYFHKLVKVRNSKNNLSHLLDEHGHKVEDADKIK